MRACGKKAVVAAVAVVTAASVVACGAPEESAGSSDEVQVGQGRLHGFTDGAVRRFTGVPFAAPPVGARRWAPPAPPAGWSGVREATKPANVCAQPREGLGPGQEPSEDCLYLNVTMPSKPSSKPRPVLVFLHGGGFIGGSGGETDPRRMAEQGDLIVVTPNYRLGVFGGFTHPALGRAGSFFLQDQQAALAWVKANAAAFDGDGGNVTLAGQSAGAMSVCSQLASPAAAGLFDKAIIASGSCVMDHPAGALSPDLPTVSTWKSRDDINGISEPIATGLGCPDPKTALACLRAVPPEKLVPTSAAFSFVPFGTDVLPQDPGKSLRQPWSARVPVLAGNTSDEHLLNITRAYANATPETYHKVITTAFGAKAADVERFYPLGGYATPDKALDRAFTDRDWICATVDSNHAYAKTAPAWTYVFDEPEARSVEGVEIKPGNRPASTHGADLPYLFWTDPNDKLLTPAQRALGDRMVAYWAAFARTGDPNLPTPPQWPTTTPTESAGLMLNSAPGGVRVTDIGAKHHCAFWRS